MPNQFLIDFRCQQLFGFGNKTLSKTMCSFLHFRVTSTLLDPNILPCSLSLRPQVTLPSLDRYYNWGQCEDSCEVRAMCFCWKVKAKIVYFEESANQTTGIGDLLFSVTKFDCVFKYDRWIFLCNSIVLKTHSKTGGRKVYPKFWTIHIKFSTTNVSKYCFNYELQIHVHSYYICGQIVTNIV
jgi:hypothetical protein